MAHVRTSLESFLGQLGQELRASVHAGAALAALTVISGCDGDAVVLAGAGGSRADAADAAVAVELAPVPPESIGCFGPEAAPHPGMMGFYGQCCFTQRCETRPAGAACETYPVGGPVPDVLRAGSGGCTCATEGHDRIAGPYAPLAAVGSADPDTTCCYVVGHIACDGRPFVVAGVQRIAAAVPRGDWGLAA
jgi:hypothetical protein